MSHIATAWAYKQPIEQGPKFVLVALADFADENGSCYPGQERIARMTGMHRSSVVRHLKTLEEIGLIVRSKRHGAGGQRTSDRYTLNLETNVADSNVGISNVAGTNVGSEPNQCRNLSEPMSHPATVTVREPSENRKDGARKRGTRIPEDYTPTPKNLEWAITKTPDVDIDTQTEKFINHFLAAPGQKGVKLDWHATWRNWMLQQQEWAIERRPKNEAGTGFWGREIA